MAGAGGGDGEAWAPAMEIIEMSDELRRKQEIVNGLNIFLEENVSLEEFEEKFDILDEEETISEDGSSKEAQDIVRTPQKVSLRSISSMIDEEQFGFPLILILEHFPKEDIQMEKKRKRLERFGLL
ncbi:unnamed protein product [Nyctereutes procyonoides]|uniref:(raccoon dog) hypothetical protein n=1 Tax=Nyctereutes procyonoides TaxID=34880 RepID=A0A811ZB51_NYCPR|nr:unnamed protein product [Nyctereutes procyonoides]